MVDIQNLFGMSSSTSQQINNDLNIYINMGFEQSLAERAFVMYGDNIQEATTWLLRQSSLGEMPKRFKNTNKDFVHTFYKSKIRIEDDMFYVSDYDPKYNIIQISPMNMYFPLTWLSISDPNIDWVNVAHDTPPKLNRVKYNWTRTIGAVTMNIKECRFWSWSEFMVLTGEKNFGNLTRPTYVSNWNNNPFTENEKLIYSLYRLTDKTDVQFRFVPDYPKVSFSGWDQRRINSEKNLQWGKFILICEISKIPEPILDDLILSRNTDIMKEKILNLTSIGLTDDTINDLLKAWRKYRKPKETIQRQIKLWEKYCKSYLNFNNMEIMDAASGIINVDIEINDLMFLNRYNNDALGVFNSFHYSRKINFMHLRRVFENIYGTVKCNLKVNQWVLLEDWEKKFLDKCKRKTKMFTKHNMKNDVLNISDYTHQNVAISWLLEREEKGRSYGVVGWNKEEEPDGFTWWRSSWGFIKLTAASPDNIVGGYPCKGGILCQSVGAGKTYELIKLTEIQKKRLVTTKPTLVIVPTSMLSVWKQEVEKFSPDLKCILYHGSRRRKINCSEYDIVITSYRLTVNEQNSICSPLFETNTWGRIICDECHYIKDVYSKTFKAVNNITAPIKWCVSATPFSKNFLDFSAYLCFLGIHPFNEKPRITLNSLLNMAEDDSVLAELFFNSMEKNVFYQTRKQIDELSNIQKIKIKYHKQIIHTPYEKLYKTLFNASKQRIQNYTRHSSVMQMIQRMRMAAFHPQLIPEDYYGDPLPIGKGGVATASVSFESFEIEDGGEYNNTIKERLEEYKEKGGSCCVCLDTVERPTMTACGHMYCYECIHNAFSHQNTKQCPICRTNLEHDILYELKEDGRDMASSKDCIIEKEIKELYEKSENDLYHEDNENIKIPKLIWIVNKIKNGDKLVVFTQYNRVLEYMKIILDSYEIPYGFINGSMPIKKRGKAIHDFQTNDNIKIFILTTKSANTGITLTSASSIVFLEPCTNKNKYIQAIGRINRLGQKKREINVYTLISEYSIEPYIDSKVGTTNWLKKIKLI